MADLLHIIKTVRYANDSRLLKWISSLNNAEISSKVFVLQDDNKEGKWEEEGTSIITSSLFFRKFFKKKKGYLFKIPEFTFKTMSFLRKSKEEVLVFHDLQQYLALFLMCINKKRKIVWDMHELPHEVLVRFYMSRKILEYILNKVDLIIYTNKERRAYMLDKLTYREKDYEILNNYPNRFYFEEPRAKLPDDLEEWLMGKKYIIWLGYAEDDRNIIPFLEVFKRRKDNLRLVIIGKVLDNINKYIQEQGLQDSIYNAFVAPEKMIEYIDNAQFSVVLYKNVSPNFWFCEPNRLYQLTSRNIPVIVGNNPVLKSFVEEYDAGIILNDDGSDADQLELAVNEMMDKAEFYRGNLERSNIGEFALWEKQFEKVAVNMKKLIKN